MSHRPTRQHLILNAFLMSNGHHEAAWRHPKTDPRHALTLQHYVDIAKTAERGKLDSLFLADGRVAFVDFGFFKQLSRGEAAVQRDVLVAVHQHDNDRLFELMRDQGVLSGRNERELELLMEVYDTLCGWLLVDDEVTISPNLVTEAIMQQGKMSRSEIRMPASQIVAARAYVLVLAILGQLQASNNWSRIVREVLYDEPPVTDLGRAEASWLAERGLS